ncbi:MAG: TrmH family RNA methyltransferase [Ilumatobacteraceae bacterium]
MQRLRRLLSTKSERDEAGSFVVEGRHLLEEALRAKWQVREIFVDPARSAASLAGLDVQDVPVHELQDGVLERVATTESPQGVIAEVARRRFDERPRGWVLAVDRLADPGNLGTLIRSAEAFGAGAVVCTTGTVDPFNPKALRAAAGATFHVPVLVDRALDDLRHWGFRVLGTTSHESPRVADIGAADLGGEVAVVLGNEAHGLDADAPVDEWVSIPHLGRSESLNVAMAGTVVSYVVSSRRSRA